MFVYGMVHRCAGTFIIRPECGLVTADMNQEDVKPVHSLELILGLCFLSLISVCFMSRFFSQMFFIIW